MTKVQSAEQAMKLAEKYDLDELEIPGVVRFRRRAARPSPLPLPPPKTKRDEADEQRKAVAHKAQVQAKIAADLERFEGGGL